MSTKSSKYNQKFKIQPKARALRTTIKGERTDDIEHNNKDDPKDDLKDVLKDDWPQSGVGQDLRSPVQIQTKPVSYLHIIVSSVR